MAVVIVTDLAYWTYDDYIKCQKLVSDFNIDASGEYLSKVVMEWDFADDPSDPRSYGDLDIIDYMRVTKAVMSQVENLFKSARPDRGIELNIKMWRAGDYGIFAHAAQAGNLPTVFKFITKIVTKWPYGDVSEDTLNELDLEKISVVMTTVNRAIEDRLSEGN